MYPPSDEVTACCKLTYSHPLVRYVFGGESLHPGGLSLTTKLAQLARIDARSSVLDAGCGFGASAVHLAKTIGCQVTGVTLEPEGVEAALALARREEVTDRVTFILGDIREVELNGDQFDAALLECVFSIVPDKETTLRRLRGYLRPGGRLALADVTVHGALPPALHGVLAAAACLANARALEGYRDLVEETGFVVETCRDLPEVATSFLSDLRLKVMMAEVAHKLGKLSLDAPLLAQAGRTLRDAECLMRQGVLSYALIVANNNQHDRPDKKSKESIVPTPASPLDGAASESIIDASAHATM